MVKKRLWRACALIFMLSVMVFGSTLMAANITTHGSYFLTPSYSVFESLRRRYRKIDFAPRASQAVAPASCTKKYEEFLVDGELNVLMAFGYKDSRPQRFVADRFERMAFIQEVTRPCGKTHSACGFEPDPEDADFFYKTVTWKDGKQIRIALQVVHSSVGPDDENNRKNDFQSWQSRHTHEAYLKALDKADVILYNGHSRAGGGPDFRPPRLTSTKEVDFTYYEASQPGLNEMIRVYNKNRRRPQSAQIVGLFSCASTSHFSRKIRSARPEVALMTSRALLYYADALENSMAALAGLVDLRCEKDLRLLMRHEMSREGTQFYHF